MTYEEAIAKIHARLRFGSKLGLDNIRALLDEMGNPQKNLKFVHVAGTNGKGTSCTYISSILREAGYKTGLYTSPFVVEFRERFIIDGEMIPENELIEQIEITSAACERLDANITEFEFITALAFNWFAQSGCDIVVLEVGLGGRFDATNIIDCPECALITSIALDHMQYLGDTIDKIAFEKAGIVKEGGNVVLYCNIDPQAEKVFDDVCAERNANLIKADISTLKIGESNLFGTDYELDGVKYHIPFSGVHQVYNSIGALNVIKVLRTKGFDISDEAVHSGFEKSHIAARMEILSNDPIILMDGGHNQDCAIALRKVIEDNLAGKNIACIIGMMADKDIDSYLCEVVPKMSMVRAVMPENPRSMKAEELADACRKYCADSEGRDNATALAEVLDYVYSTENSALVICGSFYMACEIRPFIVGGYDFWFGAEDEEDI
ncbi:MAG: folylpolyglutamate synthase/dihydrofolate synthase family protein [Clostridia bacterium]|nr:folylpolyglutamate synthase/dihydrofolate synthase family protein [Clostridia bacterium]